MNFMSDNTSPAHPKVIEALAAANAGYATPYGADALTDQAADRVREVFKAPDAAVYFVALGTAANSLLLATQSQPWQTIFCQRVAHIQEDECNAPEFFTHGAKLTLVDGEQARIDPSHLRAAIEGEEVRGVHGPQRGPISLTQATERGTVYSLEQIQSITALAREFNLQTHLDGARFANAMVSLGCSAADMTWKSGIDTVSFGGTKNGLLGVEAAIIFDPDKAQEFEYRRKRGAHLFSKHRYLAAQMLAYLEDGLWTRMAERSNAMRARLEDGLRASGVAKIMFPPGANMMFVEMPRKVHQALHAAGAQYYVWTGSLDGDDPDEMLTARLVTSWCTSERDVDQFLDVVIPS